MEGTKKLEQWRWRLLNFFRCTQSIAIFFNGTQRIVSYFFVAVDEQGDAEKKEHLNHHSTQDAKSEPLVSSNQSTVLEQSELSNLESNGN